MKWLTDFKIHKDEFINRKIPKIRTDPNKLAYLYFYEDEEYKNDKGKGYIGVTTNYERRFGEHGDRFYSESSNIKPIVLFKGALELCLKLENYLRPKPGMGWNKSKGGGFYLETENSIEKAKITRKKNKDSIGGYVGDHLNSIESVNKRTLTQIENYRSKGSYRSEHLHTPEVRSKALESKINNFSFLGLDPFYMIRTPESIQNNIRARKLNASLRGEVTSHWLQSKESREKAIIAKSKTIYKYDFKGNLIATYFNEKSYSEITGNNSSVARSNQDPFFVYTKDKDVDFEELLNYKINKSKNYLEINSKGEIISIANKNSKLNGMRFYEYKRSSSNEFITAEDYLNKSSETIPKGSTLK